MEDTLIKIENQLSRLIKCDLLPSNTYLAGGTAVYFYLRHRVSVDLDFFTPAEFNPEVVLFGLKQCFAEVHLEVMEKGTIIANISKDKIKFSLFRYPYKLLYPLRGIVTRDNTKFFAASLEDIESMKSVAICQRGSAKDFIDMYFLLKQTGHSFSDLLQLVLSKYDLEEGYRYQLKTSIVYFEDAEKEIDMITMLDNGKEKRALTQREWQEIKDFFLGYGR